MANAFFDLFKFFYEFCAMDAVRIAARFLMVGSRIFLRILKDFGVTSSSSSVSINSSACSKLKILGGVKRSASSALEGGLQYI